VSGDRSGPSLAPVTGDVLDYDDVMEALDPMMDWLAKTYVNALNIIHYMHDKYCYEAIEMALHDRDILRTMACGIAASRTPPTVLSAIKYARVAPVRDERGVIVDFKTDRRVPVLRQQRRPRRRHRQDAGVDDDEQDPDVPDVSQRRAHAVGADDHVERRVRQDDRHDPGRPQKGSVRAGREPVQREGHARRAGRVMSVAKIPYDDARTASR
jgi:hypothetical protein